jgi:hypothetical protein
MDNYLDSGGVLPSGLLSGNDFLEKTAGFNKTYKNYPLRVGIVSTIFAYNDPQNFTKLSTEYNVSVFEQNEDRGSTILTYKNCIAADGLGSIADFFEKNFRVKTTNDNPAGGLNSTYQNGAIVILLCLDAVSEKAVIIGGLNHPNRPTTLIDTQPRLQGEYNGVNIAVNPDGSTSLTFKGATAADGSLVNPGQGNTEFQIKQDGSFQFSHSTINISADRSGLLTITANGNIDITTNANTNIKVASNAVVNVGGDCDVTAGGKIVATAKEIDLNGNSGDPGRGVIDANGTFEVVDFITGVPVIPSTTVFIDV